MQKKKKVHEQQKTDENNKDAETRHSDQQGGPGKRVRVGREGIKCDEIGCDLTEQQNKKQQTKNFKETGAQKLQVERRSGRTDRQTYSQKSRGSGIQSETKHKDETEEHSKIESARHNDRDIVKQKGKDDIDTAKAWKERGKRITAGIENDEQISDCDRDENKNKHENEDLRQDHQQEVHHHHEQVPVWHKRYARCPKCGHINDKSVKQARMSVRPFFRGWHCEQCKAQTLSNRWVCGCGNLVTACPVHGQDPLEHSTTKRWATENRGEQEQLATRQLQAPPMAKTTIDKKRGMIYKNGQVVLQSESASGIKRKANFDPNKFPKMAAKMAMWEAIAMGCPEITNAATATDGNRESSGTQVVSG